MFPVVTLFYSFWSCLNIIMCLLVLLFTWTIILWSVFFVLCYETQLLVCHRLTSALAAQVEIELHGAAKLGAPVFAVQCFRLCDGSRFSVDFMHGLQPTTASQSLFILLHRTRCIYLTCSMLVQKCNSKLKWKIGVGSLNNYITLQGGRVGSLKTLQNKQNQRKQ